MNCNYILFSHLYDKTLTELLAPDKRWLQELVELLHDHGTPGMAILFYHSGWQGLVRGELLGTVDNPSIDAARQALELAHQIEAAATQHSPDGTCRLRIVTALDLLPVVQKIAVNHLAIPRELLANFLGTNFSGSRYDFPKLVESLIRLRNPPEIPVLRIDQDVLFNDIRDEKTGFSAPATLRSPIQCMVTRCRRWQSQSERQPLLISGQYQVHTSQEQSSAWSPTDWLTTFATRPYPALIINDSGDLEFEDATLRAYYGIDATGTDLELTADGQPKGLASIGAPPLGSPISGALMFLSQDLAAATPPFCNFRMNVVWIDDFLNYAIHRELFRTADQTPGSEFSHTPLYADCKLAKARPSIEDAREYALTNYLPALARGCILDAWIQPDSRTKIEPQRAAPPGPFIRHLQTALQSGGLTPIAAERCRQELKQSALQRLNEVQRQWSSLPNATPHPTLAVEWIAEGNLASQVELETLLDDTLEYIEWAVAWPDVVQTVRHIPRRTLKLDLPAGPER